MNSTTVVDLYVATFNMDNQDEGTIRIATYSHEVSSYTIVYIARLYTVKMYMVLVISCS